MSFSYISFKFSKKMSKLTKLIRLFNPSYKYEESHFDFYFINIIQGELRLKQC